MFSPEDTEYIKVISDARAKPEKCVVPAMPCIPQEECSGKPDAMPLFKCPEKPEAMKHQQKRRDHGKTTKTQGPHLRKKDTCPMSHDGMVHKPIATKKDAMKIAEAQAAVDKECGQLANLLAWDYKQVKAKSEVVQQAKKDGRYVHLASSWIFATMRNLRNMSHARSSSR